jgi:hypothetical protein
MFFHERELEAIVILNVFQAVWTWGIHYLNLKNRLSKQMWKHVSIERVNSPSEEFQYFSFQSVPVKSFKVPLDSNRIQITGLTSWSTSHVAKAPRAQIRD